MFSTHSLRIVWKFNFCPHWTHIKSLIKLQMTVFAQAFQKYLEAKNNKKVRLNGTFVADLSRNIDEVLF